MHPADEPFFLAICKAGMMIAIKRAIIAMTTNNSMSVNAFLLSMTLAPQLIKD
jgi:hypothetical protein